jgi:hypothetical protein
VACANDVPLEPLETVRNRSHPMGCGPNVDQATTINLPSRGFHAGMLGMGACLDRLTKVLCVDRVPIVECVA